eukprot:TRINITY_DN2328_c0_g1_i1.p1 TRINITY_DN2328_c0_g1~~TRINITY_DN2328_c0_g1_i1.p1  ORF type:complete len:198 (-),score=37.70 TRINITY_DN2328_c0_g1_i1:113-706(-)
MTNATRDEERSSCSLEDADDALGHVNAKNCWIEKLYEKAESSSLDQLIEEAETYWRDSNNPSTTPQSEQEWDLHFNAICMKLACYNAACLVPVVDAYEKLEYNAFLDLVRGMKQVGMEGHLIRWTYEECNQDIEVFRRAVLERDVAVFENVNKKADAYESFEGLNENIGRLPILQSPRNKILFGVAFCVSAIMLFAS